MSQNRTNSAFRRSFLPAAILLTAVGISTASAHISYSGRDFGTFTPGDPAVTLSSTVGQTFGWAHGTTDSWGDTHDGRFFRFTLTETTSIQISVQRTGSGSEFLPGFSVFEGLAHLSPHNASHDGSTLSRNSRPDGKNGSFRSLNDWSVGNDPTYNEPGNPESGVRYEASLRHFTYIGHAADGTSANFGDADGIFGDGIADGWVTGSFIDLGAGDYSIFVGGADLFNQNTGSYNFDITMAAIPEPSTYAVIAGVSALGVLLFRRRRQN